MKIKKRRYFLISLVSLVMVAGLSGGLFARADDDDDDEKDGRDDDRRRVITNSVPATNVPAVPIAPPVTVQQAPAVAPETSASPVEVPVVPKVKAKKVPVAPATVATQEAVPIAPVAPVETSAAILADSDNDGIADGDDPHPDVPEIYIVEDNNKNGIVDGFEK